jgi:hypothetical protein
VVGRTYGESGHRYTRGMPYYQRLVELLALAPHRVNAAGEIELTTAEAGMLRACGFLDAKPGWWRIPADSRSRSGARLSVPPDSSTQTRDNQP